MSQWLRRLLCGAAVTCVWSAPSAEAGQSAALQVTARVVSECAVRLPPLPPSRAARHPDLAAFIEQRCSRGIVGRTRADRVPAETLRPPRTIRKLVRGDEGLEVVLVTISY
jgi:hypothetical protein